MAETFYLLVSYIFIVASMQMVESLICDPHKAASFCYAVASLCPKGSEELYTHTVCEEKYTNKKCCRTTCDGKSSMCLPVSCSSKGLKDSPKPCKEAGYSCCKSSNSIESVLKQEPVLENGTPQGGTPSYESAVTNPTSPVDNQGAVTQQPELPQNPWNAISTAASSHANGAYQQLSSQQPTQTQVTQPHQSTHPVTIAPTLSQTQNNPAANQQQNFEPQQATLKQQAQQMQQQQQAWQQAQQQNIPPEHLNLLQQMQDLAQRLPTSNGQQQPNHNKAKPTNKGGPTSKSTGNQQKAQTGSTLQGAHSVSNPTETAANVQQPTNMRQSPQQAKSVNSGSAVPLQKMNSKSKKLNQWTSSDNLGVMPRIGQQKQYTSRRKDKKARI